MHQIFKSLRIIAAIALLACTIIGFAVELYHQSGALLDGPLAHYMSYTFALNDIVLAALLALVLIFDFELNLPSWGRMFIRVIGILSIGLVLAGYVFLFEQQRFTGGLFWTMVQLYAFQTAFLLIAIIVLGKSYHADWARMRGQGESDA